MERINNTILKIASKDKPTVITKLFNETTKSRLCRLRIKIISLVEDNYFESTL